MSDIGASYHSPVDKLLTLGQPKRHGSGVDYTTLGISREHVPELVRMAKDEALNSAPSETLFVWAPVHAWWALAQLRAKEAVVPLIGLLRRVDEKNDDWVGEEIPRVLAAIGPEAIAPLAEYLADPTHGDWARVGAAVALGKIGQQYPDARGECVARLTAQLTRSADQPLHLNAFLISPLLDLRAAEAAPVMEQAFVAGRVDETVAGDWEDVQIELGLKTHREHPRKPDKFAKMGEQLRAALEPAVTPATEARPVSLVAPRKVGRNDPCPCGSGKKFKKCCGC